MPNIKGAKKRVKTSNKRRESNVAVKGAMKTAIKKVNKTGEVADLNNSIKKIDKALKKGIIKKNTAARKKSQIMKNQTQAK